MDRSLTEQIKRAPVLFILIADLYLSLFRFHSTHAHIAASTPSLYMYARLIVENFMFHVL